MSTEVSETAQDAGTLEEQYDDLSWKYSALQESMADVVLALDNIGWNLIGTRDDYTRIPLQTVRNTAMTTRALLAINPLIKRGIAIRCSYVFGEGVTFKGIPETDPLLKSKVAKKFLFSRSAQFENERLQGTDGQIFILLQGTPEKPKPIRVPMKQIVGVVTDPDNEEDVWFYRREWTTVVWDEDSSQNKESTNIVYYPADDYDEDENGAPARMQGYPVNWDARILHGAVNKQEGWVWGTPDLMPVIFWSDAYKQFLENSATLVKAYSRFAFKVTADQRGAQTAAATKVAAQPARDPLTGRVENVGGTAVMNAGTTLQTIGRTGGSVDFKAGEPLAAMVAAGLEIPLTMLTSDGGSANRSSAETLDTPTIKAMEARQAFWGDIYTRVFEFYGHEGVEVVFEDIDSEAAYRQVQAIAQAALLNVLSAKEIRAALIQAFDMDDADPEALPTKDELGNMILQLNMAADQSLQAKQAVQNDAAAGAGPSTQGTAAGGKPDYANKSNGDNSHREDVGQHSYSGGKNG